MKQEEQEELPTDRIVWLVSSDGEKIAASRNSLRLSKTLNNMFKNLNMDDNPAMDCEEIPVARVHSETLRILLDWCWFHIHTPKPEMPYEPPVFIPFALQDAPKTKKVPTCIWDIEFFRHLDLNQLYDLIKSADYLDVENLLEVCYQRIADLLEGKGIAEIMQDFEMEQEFTEDEWKQIREDCAWAEPDKPFVTTRQRWEPPKPFDPWDVPVSFELSMQAFFNSNNDDNEEDVDGEEEEEEVADEEDPDEDMEDEEDPENEEEEEEEEFDDEEEEEEDN